MIYPPPVLREILEEYGSIEEFERMADEEDKRLIIRNLLRSFRASRALNLEPLTINVFATLLLFISEDKNFQSIAKEFFSK